MMPADALPSDSDLLRAFQAGDDGAFETLYARWQGPALRYASRMVGVEEAEEIVTDAFVTVVRGKAAPTGSFRSYLFTVVHRRCLDRLRRRKTRATRLHLLVPTPETPDLDGSIDRHREVERLERAVATLPETHRATLLLYYGEGLPSAEVAEILGIADQQVRSRLSYARKALKAALEAG
ncbi:MAG: sigma-70 family RNA polymerase sigma factor [Myxococcales bacterium]|nr:sigma-70 family RNA polymerase sigma factor [Myxococcales bacterium]MCB9693663.1 sigma-70 family RNA polymerase sigma factor [Alphaproteobacteria bacterium]